MAAFPVLVPLPDIYFLPAEVEVENVAMFCSILVHVNATSSNTPAASFRLCTHNRGDDSAMFK